MKKLNTLLAVAGLVLPLAPAAQATITATGFFDTIFHANNVTVDDSNPGDWLVNSAPAGDIGCGTLEIAGGSVLDTGGFTLMPVGWGSSGTLTVTGSGSKFLDINGLVLGNNNGAGSLIVDDGGWVDLGSSSNALQMNVGATATLLLTLDGSESGLTAQQSDDLTASSFSDVASTPGTNTLTIAAGDVDPNADGADYFRVRN